MTRAGRLLSMQYAMERGAIIRAMPRPLLQQLLTEQAEKKKYFTNEEMQNRINSWEES